MIGRRHQLAAMLGALVAPRVAAAQDRRRPRLAFFATILPEAVVSETGGDTIYRIIFRELRRHGYEEGGTIDVLRWSARGDRARYPELAREIVRSQPDVIYTGTTDQVKALLAHTTTIPIIVQNVENLVEAGFADSFSRPGRNITGVSISINVLDFLMKRLQLLREAVPAVSRVAVLVPRAPGGSGFGDRFREAASGMGVTLVWALLDDPIQPAEYRRVFAAMPDQRIDAVWITDFPVNYVHRHLIIDLATDSRLPVISGLRDATERGGLMSYGADLAAYGHIMADYVVRVLKGEKPADLPLRSFDRFELVVNLKTARALGLTIPQSLLLRADEVIE